MEKGGGGGMVVWWCRKQCVPDGHAAAAACEVYAAVLRGESKGQGCEEDNHTYVANEPAAWSLSLCGGGYT